MSAYATPQREQSGQLLRLEPSLLQAIPAAMESGRTTKIRPPASAESSRLGTAEASVIDELLDCFAERVAAAVAAQLRTEGADRQNEWFDSRQAAEYLGLHRDSLRRLAAERTIPAEQDGPGCKLYFRRAALDDWRRTGGRAGHLAILAGAA